MINFPNSPAVNDIFSFGVLQWIWTGLLWKSYSAPIDYTQGEVAGNATSTPGPPIPTDVELMLRSSIGDGTAGQVLTAGGTGIASDWAAPSTTPLPTLTHAQVLGNPAGSPATAVGTDAERMLRSSIGDGTSGQVYTSGGTGVAGSWATPSTFSLGSYNTGYVTGNPTGSPATPVATDFRVMMRAAMGDGTAGQVPVSGGTGINPAWGTLAKRYEIGCYAPGVPAASQVMLVHVYSGPVTIPADGGTYDSHSSKARGTTAATASTIFAIQRALAASPTTFSNVGTITFAIGAVVGTISTSGSPVSFAAGDTLQIVAPATPDATFAGLSCTVVGQA